MRRLLINIYYSFPIQLLLLHFRNYQILLVIWAILVSTINSGLLKNFGADSLFFVPEYMANHAEVYEPNVLNHDLNAHLAKLKKNGWGDETEIHAMSQMFEMDFEIWVPDRDNGAVTQTEYPEGKDCIALAYYPGVHYDYLHKLRINLSPPCLESNVIKSKGSGLVVLEELDSPVVKGELHTQTTGIIGLEDGNLDPGRCNLNGSPDIIAESKQSGNTSLLPVDPSLFVTKSDEGPSLNVNQESSGPK